MAGYLKAMGDYFARPWERGLVAMAWEALAAKYSRYPLPDFSFGSRSVR